MEIIPQSPANRFGRALTQRYLASHLCLIQLTASTQDKNRINLSSQNENGNSYHFNIYRYSVQSLSHVRLFATPWTAAHQASLSIASSSDAIQPSISSSVIPFSSHLQSCPSRSFPMSQFFTSGGQSIRASASVLLMNIQN